MDVRIETFMRDVASDKGQPAAAVAAAAGIRLARLVEAVRLDGSPATAGEREAAFLAALAARIRDEMSRYPGTRTEAHFAAVLGAVRVVTPTLEPEPA